MSKRKPKAKPIDGALLRDPVEAGVYLPAGYYTRDELKNALCLFPRPSLWRRLWKWL